MVIGTKTYAASLKRVQNLLKDRSSTVPTPCFTLQPSLHGRKGADSQSMKYCVITTSNVDVWGFLLG